MINQQESNMRTKPNSGLGVSPPFFLVASAGASADRLRRRAERLAAKRYAQCLPLNTPNAHKLFFHLGELYRTAQIQSFKNNFLNTPPYH